MPRPNQPRNIQGETELARRITLEREARAWSYEGLASRMTDAGCPIQGSAIYKIEKGDPPRRITVDELIALAAVFELPVPDLLRPREVVVNQRLGRLFDKWDRLRHESLRAQVKTNQAFKEMARFVQEQHSDALEPFLDRVQEWAETTAEGESEAHKRAVAAYVISHAVPIEPFKELEREALEALAAELED